MKQPIDKAAYEQQRVDNYNATAGTLTDYDCPKCRNKGNIAHVREDGSLAFTVTLSISSVLAQTAKFRTFVLSI